MTLNLVFPKNLSPSLPNIFNQYTNHVVIILGIPVPEMITLTKVEVDVSLYLEMFHFSSFVSPIYISLLRENCLFSENQPIALIQIDIHPK